MRLVVGLGNPGEKYRRTRHNLGFMVLDALAAAAGVDKWRSESDALVASIAVGAEPVLLVKPQTFMNRSGAAVAPLLAAHAEAGLLVVLDDVAIELGTIRIRERGSHGGHNGLRSIIETLGTEDFPRLRVGIRKGEPEGDLADYVLAPFPEEDVLVVQEVVGYAADALRCATSDGTNLAMSRYNGGLK